MRRVGLIVVPDVGALSVFELANAKSGEPYYDLVVMSEHGNKDAPASRPVQRTGVVRSLAILGGRVGMWRRER
jgi:hypothetical protein